MGVISLRETRAVCVDDASQVSLARREAHEVARTLGFDDTLAGQVALAVTEAATNLVKHAGGGEVLLSALETRGTRVVEMVALDRGHGMASAARCLEDGYSTAGSAGIGLGAVRRLSSHFELYSRPGGGTALLARIGAQAGAPAPPANRILVRGVSVACEGETVCGDAWDEEPQSNGVTLVVVDGLGHGAGAAEAAREGVIAFRAQRGMPPATRVDALHAALRATRGAAVAVATIDTVKRIVRFTGLGNISAIVYGATGPRRLVSQHGTAGAFVRRLEEYTCPWPARGVLVMYSDGITTLRDVESYPGLLERDPGIVAGVLYRDHSRRRDDATVVVAREVAA
jgi:anti-sigma regulatory factor (Ser/Thr protein kinase)